MSNIFLGEIRMFGGNFAPLGWAFCDGTLMAISQAEALFQLIGTTYGGDGQQTFALPDLRGRAPIHQGPGHAMGQLGGSETVALTTGQLPQHGHFLTAVDAAAGTVSSPDGHWLARSTNVKLYTSEPADNTLNPGAITPTGGSGAHENRQPFLVVNFIIALAGIFPTQN